MKKIQRSLLAALLVMTAILFWACSPAPTQTTVPKTVPASNAPPETTLVQPAPPQSVPFNADGTITPGEYANNVTYDDYELYWDNDDEYVYIGMKAKTQGFVAVGIQPGTAMLDADIILGFVQNGTAQVFDMYSTGIFGPHPQDTELGGMDNILDPAGAEDGQYTVIEFKRALDTGDKYDNPLVKGTNKIIWAYGPNKDPNLKHSARGYGEIEIK